MSDDLFRPAALAAVSGERWGRPVALLPPAWFHLTGLFVLFLAVALTFVSTANFARRETVRGRLRPTLTEARIFAAATGVVSTLNVRLGDVVRPGQVLAEVYTERQIDGANGVNETVLSNLLREKESLEAKKTTHRATARLNRNRIGNEIATGRRQRLDIATSAALARRRVTIAEERLESSARLQQQGAASREEGRAREDALITLRQQLAEFERGSADLAQKERTLQIDVLRVDQDLQQSLAEVDEQLSQLASQVARTRAESGFVLTAPIAGRVAALQTSEGARVDPAHPLMTILPLEGQLVAQVFLPSRAIAFVEPGQSVKLLYDAFPYQNFGTASGHILSVSTATFAPQELNRPMGDEGPVYEATVVLDHQSMLAFSRDIPLQSGMELSADIILERRRLLDWILEPVAAATRRFRD
jgi:membrane fusion protein